MAERLIDAKALTQSISKGLVGLRAYEGRRMVEIVADCITNAPTIEAKPVVHAHWNDDGRCTNCGEHAPFLLWADTWYESKYCHGCGAQMDEVVSDNNVGSKGVKIPVISMEDVPKMMEEKE